MKRLAILAGALALAFAWAAAPAMSQDKKEQDKGKAAPAKVEKHSDGEVLCPVMDEPIDPKKSVSVQYKGKPVYLCCDECIEKFNKNPDKYAEKIKAQWDAMKPLRTQIKCPASGKPINAKMVVATDHGDVYFCCPNCKGQWEKDSKPMQAKLEECYTYQTECVVEGGPIDPKVAEQIDGTTVYFCCKDCIVKFKQDQAANMKKLEAQTKANKEAFAKKYASHKP